MLIFGLSSSSRTLASWSFQENQTYFKDCLGRGAWYLRVLAKSLFWIKILKGALPTASAFKISPVASAPEKNVKQVFIDLNFKWSY